LSKKVDTKIAISKFSELKSPLNFFLANCNLVFGDLESLQYYKTKEAENYKEEFNKSICNRKSKLKINLKLIKINLIRRLGIVCKSIFNKEIRKWTFNTIKRKIKF
jgi:hypothetical protein